jgi:hypothetical protein
MGCIDCGRSDYLKALRWRITSCWVWRRLRWCNNEAMSLLHQRLDHADMEEIKRTVGHVDFWVKRNATQLPTYDACRVVWGSSVA